MVVVRIKNFLLALIGSTLHRLLYKRLPRSIKSSLIMMGGPSANKDVIAYQKHWDIAVASNLIDPVYFMKKVDASFYIHCFSDPSFLQNKIKFKKFKLIVSRNAGSNYLIVVPVQYIKSIWVLGKFFQGKISFYNANHTYHSKGFHIDKFSFPNMQTILLDCALPLMLYAEAKKIYITGFDADYGNGEVKQYSDGVMSGSENESVKQNWAEHATKNALMMCILSKNFYCNQVQVNFSKCSGFYKKYRNWLDNV